MTTRGSDHLSLWPEDEGPRDIDAGLAEVRSVSEQAISDHRPTRTFLLLSGGNDSMALLDACADYADEIVHINTGIGIPETNEFVRQVVADRGRELTELHPPITYEELVLERIGGFPGPSAHRYAYIWLKERCIEALLRHWRLKRGQRFMLLAGVRQAESERRMGRELFIDRRGGQVWVNPILRWSNELCQDYREERALPVNEVTKHLHMSGECLCGAYARPGELDEIAFFYPAVAERIRNLEGEARERGLKNCQWGVKPPRPGKAAPGPMCQSCSLWDQHVEGV